MIYLALTDDKIDQVLESIPDKSRPKKFLFLSSDYKEFTHWKSALEKRHYVEIEISTKLQTTSQELTEPFLSLLGKLSQKYASDLWWSNRISERNTLVTPLFLNCCFLKIADETPCSSNEDILILVRYASLFSSIEEQFKAIGKTYVRLSSPVSRSLLGRIKKSKRIIVNLLKQSFEGIKFRFHAKKTRDSTILNPSKSPIVLHTYYSPKNAHADGMLKDIYFPGLRDWLSNKGYDVLILPVHSGFENAKDFFKILEKYKVAHINPHAHLTILDYLRAIVRFIKSMNIPSPNDNLQIAKLDCTSLILAERDVFYSGLFRFFLYKPLFKRLSSVGFNPKYLICVFENMIAEKMLTISFKENFVDKQIFAYQHASIPKNFLCYNISKEEVSIAPLPDKIICNGKLSKKILAANGFPNDRLFVGPALRYSHLKQTSIPQKADYEKQWDVLSPLPLMEEECLELLTTLICAYGEEKTFKVCIKLHPMQTIDTVRESLQNLKLPKNFDIIDKEKFDELSRKSKIVVGMASGSLLEAVCLGHRVIVTARKAGLNFNPLEFFPEINTVVYNYQELLIETQNSLDQTIEEKVQYQNRCREILEKSFTLVSEQSLRYFLPEEKIK